MAKTKSGRKKEKLFRPGDIFPVFSCQVWPTVASNYYSWLTGEELNVVSCCCSPLTGDAFQLNMLVKSDHLSYHRFPVRLNKSFSSKISQQEGVSAHRTATHWISFAPSCVTVCVKTPGDQLFLKYSNSLPGIDHHD